MSISKIRIYYQSDGGNSSRCSNQLLEKKSTVTLPKIVKEYGEKNGYDKIKISHSYANLVLKGENSEPLMDSIITGCDYEWINKLTRWEWIDDNNVGFKPLNKYSKVKVYHNWQGDGRTLTLPLSKECIEYGDRYGYDKIKVSQTGWDFAMANKEGGTMIYKSFWDADSGVGEVIRIEWLNAQIEAEIKNLKNQFTKIRVNHGANYKMTVTLPKKLTEFGDRYGYDKITFVRKGVTFYLYDPDGFILLRKDCWETGLGEIKSMEWLNDKEETVPFKPSPAPFEAPAEEPTPAPAEVEVVAAPVVEPAPAPVAEAAAEATTQTISDQDAFKFELKKTTTIGVLKAAFHEAFGAQVRVYNGRSCAEDNVSLGEVGLTNEGTLECSPNLTAGNFVERMQTEFGLKVKVYTCDYFVAVIDGLTLEQAGKVKKNAVKKDMEALLAK